MLDQLGFEPPGEDDEVLGGSPAPSAAARLRLARASAVDADDPLAQVVDAIDGGTWERLAAPLIEPVLRLARADPDRLLDEIAAAYPAMDTEELTERLARILFVADVWGGLQANAPSLGDASP